MCNIPTTVTNRYCVTRSDAWEQVGMNLHVWRHDSRLTWIYKCVKVRNRKLLSHCFEMTSNLLNMLNFLSFNICYVFHVVLWIKYGFIRFANHCFLILFQFYTASQPFWYCSCKMSELTVSVQPLTESGNCPVHHVQEEHFCQKQCATLYPRGGTSSEWGRGADSVVGQRSNTSSDWTISLCLELSGVAEHESHFLCTQEDNLLFSVLRKKERGGNSFLNTGD